MRLLEIWQLLKKGTHSILCAKGKPRPRVEWLVLSPEVEALCGWLPQGDPEGRTREGMAISTSALPAHCLPSLPAHRASSVGELSESEEGSLLLLPLRWAAAQLGKESASG